MNTGYTAFDFGIAGFSACLLLLNLLLQRVEIRRGEELAQGDVQTVTELFDCQDLRICASAVKNVLYRRWRKGTNGSKLIDRDISLCTKL